MTVLFVGGRLPSTQRLKLQFFRDQLFNQQLVFALTTTYTQTTLGLITLDTINIQRIWPTNTTVLRPFFRHHRGEPVPEENFWTLWCKGRLTEADTPTIWLGTTPTGLTSAHLHHPNINNFSFKTLYQKSAHSQSDGI